ncbi:hypothetical protein RYA05_05990 [Pseudomonas syringae pv. actinidiae]|nr:hypothetical protein [Pseudomonas syringae pv. actinidiae]
MQNFKRKLEEMFATEEIIGVYQIDHDTGLTEDEFKAAGHTHEFGGVTYLPDHTSMFICTNSADYVVRTLGEGARYGFSSEDNPSATHSEIVGGGHDFAVLRKRYIVDLWISHYTGCEDKVVYDLWDKKDHEKIREIFGDPATWSSYDPLSKKGYEPSDMPQDMKISIGKPKDGMSYGM